MNEGLEYLPEKAEIKDFIGKSSIKKSLSVFACRACYVPLVVAEIDGTPKWKCPHCGKIRNRCQSFWMEYNHQIEFKEGL